MKMEHKNRPKALQGYTRQETKRALKQDHCRKEAANRKEMALNLVNNFSDIAEYCQELLTPQENYSTAIPEELSEEKFRFARMRFLNLQSLYDNAFSESDIAQQEPLLFQLQSHVSVIASLLDVGESLTHYYERHIRYFDEVSEEHPLNIKTFESLIDYVIKCCSSCISLSEHLTRKISDKYARNTEITVPAPGYRGGHVRPSTLVNKIVLHHGSRIEMQIGNRTYNTDVFELFRANEKINRDKRQIALPYIINHPILTNRNKDFRAEEVAGDIFRDLEKKGIIVIYKEDAFKDLPLQNENESIEDYMKNTLINLQYTGILDVKSSTKITFKGDERALRDIQILAENGYGEDDLGENIDLPPELDYLKSFR